MNNELIGIDALPTNISNQIEPALPESYLTKTKSRGREVVPQPWPKPRPQQQEEQEREVSPPRLPDVEPAFYCPHCDFKADEQFVMGDHVVLNHAKDHIERNARESYPLDSEMDSDQAEDVQCLLCKANLSSPSEMTLHVKENHPEVVVFEKQ